MLLRGGDFEQSYSMNNEITSINKVYAEVEKLSLFDLKRLYSAIYNLLEDPKKNMAVKQHLKIGMHIYYESDEKKMTEAIVVDVRKTKATVRNVHDNRLWEIYLSSINLNGKDLIASPKSASGNLDRNSLSIGELVGFRSKDGNDVFGEVKKLNPKKAIVVLNSGQIWHVPYSLLFLVMDGVAMDSNDCLLIEGEIVNN